MDLQLPNAIRSALCWSRAGTHQRHYDQQPAHGFYSVTYLAETQYCRILYDPDEHIRRLKEDVSQYPQRLREAVVSEALWAGRFSLYVATGLAQRGEIYGTTGCLCRIAAYLTQVLFALNDTYFSGDKGALESIAGFSCAPPAYPSRVGQVLARPGGTAEQLSASVASMRKLWDDVVRCAGPAYTPKYPLPPD